MQIKDHVVSLETAKRMKELGWATETYLQYDSDMQGNQYTVPTRSGGLHLTYVRKIPSLPAPLLSEILEALPILAGLDHMQTVDIHPLSPSYWRATVRLDPFVARNFLHSDHKNPAEAAALLWIKLREEGIISSNEKE